MQPGHLSIAHLQLKQLPMFNYIKAHRKNWGLTQRELGYIIGFDNNVRICHLERGKKRPTFNETIIFELLFDKAPGRMFPDIYRQITNELNDRLIPLEAHFRELERTQQTQAIIQRLYEVRLGIEKAKSHRR